MTGLKTGGMQVGRKCIYDLRNDFSLAKECGNLITFHFGSLRETCFCSLLRKTHSV